MSELRMWAVKGVDGKICSGTVFAKRADAISAAERLAAVQSFDWPTWQTLYRRGCRCIRVSVTEVRG